MILQDNVFGATSMDYIRKLITFRYYPFGDDVEDKVELIAHLYCDAKLLNDIPDIILFKYIITKNFYNDLFKKLTKYSTKSININLSPESIYLENMINKNNCPSDPYDFVKEIKAEIVTTQKATAEFFNQMPDLLQDYKLLKNHDYLFSSFYQLYQIGMLTYYRGRKSFEEIMKKSAAELSELKAQYKNVNNELSSAHSIIKKWKKEKNLLWDKLSDQKRNEILFQIDKCKFKNGNINYSKLGRLLGVNHKTAKEWVKKLIPGGLNNA